MKGQNHIKSPKVIDGVETLRGLGKVGYSEGSRLHSTLKRLEGSFTGNDDGGFVKAKKITAKCPHCNFRHSSRKGLLPEHKISVRKYDFKTPESEKKEWFDVMEICPQTIRANSHRKKVNKFTINGITFKKGDNVMFAKSIENSYTLKHIKFYEGPIESIYLQEDGSYLIYLPNDDDRIYGSFPNFCVNKHTINEIIKISKNV